MPSKRRYASPTVRFFTKFIRDKAAVLGLAIILFLFLMTLFPGLFASSDPTHITVGNRLAPPGAEHIMGTDQLGRDIWSRVVHGSRVSLLVAITGGFLALIVGTPIGIIVGYMGGHVDNIAMRLMDVLMAFPAVLLALMLIAAIGPGMVGVIVAVGIVYTPRFARVARGAVLSTKEEAYVEAARAAGNGMLRILFAHIMPNIMASVMILLTVSIGMIILVEATLSFLGLGLQPPYPSWGYMLAAGKDFMELSPWPVIAPGIFIMLAVMGFNLIGDGLQDVTNPKFK